MTGVAFANPSISELCATLCEVRVIAVVGLSPNPSRPSHRIAAAMQRRGFRIIPVHPAAREILGEPVSRSLREVGEPFDLVNVFRAADAVDAIVDDCVAIDARRLWIQEGIVNAPAALRAAGHGIWTVMDRCIWRDFNGLCNGNTNWQTKNGN